MPLTNAIHDSLPYIDNEPTAAERTAALALITRELDPQAEPLHPSIPPLAPSNLPPLMLQEMERLESDPKSKLKGIDTSRYEAVEPPSDKNPNSEALWKSALQQAYTSQTYLSSRSTSLALLESYGKNAWLISNSQLEAILSSLERDLAERKTEIDGIVIERKTAQESVGGEIKGLEEAWKRGVGRVLETEVAAENVRLEILERRRAGAA